MRRIFVLLALSMVSHSAFAIAFFQGRAIPHFAVGGPQWQTTFVFHNPADQLEKFSIDFHGDDGNSVAIPVSGGMSTSVLITLPPHTTYKLVSDYRPDLPLTSGSAFITLPPNCQDCGFYFSTVYTIFAMYDVQQHKFLCEATVPQESPNYNNVVLVYDQQGYVMGVALMNPSDVEIKLVTVTVYDKDNQLLRTDQFYMKPLEHRVFALTDRYPETVGRLGYVKFSTNGVTGLAGIGLRFSPNGTFTSMYFISVS